MNNKGFFTDRETQSKSHPGGQILSCAKCQLYQGAKSPKMQTFGEGQKDILCIGEAPGAHEDRKGKQWQGKAGRLLKTTLSGMGIDLFKDCLDIN